MDKRINLFVIALVVCFVMAGCVSKETYEQKSMEADKLGKGLASLQQQYVNVSKENTLLKSQLIKHQEAYGKHFNRKSHFENDLVSKSDDLLHELLAAGDGYGK